MEVFKGPPLIAGNWKMHGTLDSSRDLAGRIARELGSIRGVEVTIFPSFPFLMAVGEAIRGTAITLGGQDLHLQEKGAFTGAVSGPQLRSCGCRCVLVGHSERRNVFGETDEIVRGKLCRALASDLDPILCVGEGARERQAGQGEEVVLRQMDLALDGFDPAEAMRLTVAYEPVWAIGTGEAATPEAAAAMQGVIRTDLLDRFGKEKGSGIRVLYGGSVTPSNAADLIAQDEVDGVLVGGASLDDTSFSRIADAALAASS